MNTVVRMASGRAESFVVDDEPWVLLLFAESQFRGLAFQDLSFK